jgi:hypothetical protein
VRWAAAQGAPGWGRACACVGACAWVRESLPCSSVWLQGRDISSPEVVQAVAASVGVPDSVLEVASTPEGKAGLQQETQEAIQVCSPWLLLTAATYSYMLLPAATCD